jgi:hypothetical protein
MSGPTLHDLEDDDWGEPTYDSHLVRTVHALRRKQIADFDVEDLRIMLGQSVGVSHLIPLALTHLERDPFVSGHFYPGDLLGVVMAIDAEYWRSHVIEATRIGRVVDRARALLEGRTETEEIKTHLRRLMEAHPWQAA